MYKVFFLLILLSFCDVFSADVVTMSSTSMEPHPVYKPQDASNAYVPHMTYQDVGLQNDPYPSYPSYEDYTSYPPVSTVAAIQLLFQRPLGAILTFLSKVGFFLIGGVALFVVGGIFVTAICSLTSLCTISFAPFASMDKDTMMRAFMTPEKLATAAAIVQDAIGKYQRLQKTKNN
ncbi:uncharacterized protein LOC135123048 isoform X1 [Zophobas morio]|uniref:uncharacterized protein LOC135123048 isoform X1 n=1 Tax=Zophobas morio TaxID=2755281 RepID=UPI003082C73A